MPTDLILSIAVFALICVIRDDRLLVLALGGSSDSAAARAVRRLVVVTNWASALRQRMAPATAR